MLMAKILTKTDTTLSITFWQAAGLIPATFLLAIQVWEWPTLYQLFLFLMVAVAGTLVHWFLNEALKIAEISALLPLDYLRLIWAVTFGFIFFDELSITTIFKSASFDFPKANEIPFFSTSFLASLMPAVSARITGYPSIFK